MQHRKAISLLAVIVLSGLTVLSAQQREKKNQVGNRAARSDGQATVWRDANHLLASCVAIGNQQEVAISKWAKDKLNNQDAQDFAQMLIKDHGDFLKKLQEFAPEASSQGFLSDEEPAAGQQARTERTRRTAAKPNLETGQMPIDLMQLEREVAEQQLADMKQMLNDKDGAKFDEAFIGFQIAQHAAMASKLKVFEEHATGDFKSLLSDGLKVTKQHLSQAEDLMKDLAKKASK
jgi:predicted outer membrane protein